MYIYRYTNMDMHSKLLKFVREAMERYNKANNEVKSELNTEEKKKKDTSRKQGLYVLIFLKKQKKSYQKIPLILCRLINFHIIISVDSLTQVGKNNFFTRVKFEELR